MMRWAVVGDVHGFWQTADTEWFDAQGYDLILAVGDLGGYTERSTLATAQRMAALQTPLLVQPGNHDAAHASGLLGEVLANEWLIRLGNRGQEARVGRLRTALGKHQLTGYSRHTIGTGDERIDVIACRPHSMGGPRLAFRPYLERAFGIGTMDASAARLRGLIDEAGPRIVFLAHNGPTGLGADRDSIFGADFRAQAGDWGDPDLRSAIDHARQSGRQVLAVLAGHMHHHLRGGGIRPWERREEDGCAILNAASVPRIRRGLHHHLRLVFGPSGVEAEQVHQPLSS